MSKVTKKAPARRSSAGQQPLTVKEFNTGLDRFYEKKIKPRFDEHDRCFDAHDKRFDEHDSKFNDLFAHIDGLYKRLEDLSIEYHAIAAALTRIEAYQKQDAVDKRLILEEIKKIKSDISSLTARVESLEKQIAM
jgi:chromosome segregation ATPase